MADNTTLNTGTGGDNIATDDVATLNGAASSGVKVQRVKVGFGVDGDFTDASAGAPLPVFDAQIADLDLILRRVLNALNAPQGYDKSLQRQRGTVIVESGTVTTVTTVATVTNLSTVDTLQGCIQVYGANLSAWADTVRARIT